MQHKMRFWVALLTVLGLSAANLPAPAQDYPTHKGNNQRQGRNADPYGSGPGNVNLRWWHPNQADGAGLSYVRDNTSLLVTMTANWGQPIAGGNEASYPFIPVRTGNAAEDANVSSFFNPLSTNNGTLPIVPRYYLAFTTPSAFNADPTAYDPTVPAAGTAETFTWDVTPDDATPRNYGVYVWLPAGPTDTATGTYYPQRYFVYSVQFAGGKRFVDVVDSSVAGAGWVRLGAGGAPTNMAFPYDGTNSLTVTLYNTIPRDSNGNLLITPDQPTTLVYADAAMSTPAYGSYSASPIINQLTGGTVTNVVAALNQYQVGLVGTTYTTTTQGIVTSYNAADGSVRWTYSPLQESEATVTLDAPSTMVVPDSAWTNSTIAPNYQGAGYYTAALVPWQATGPPAGTGNVVYSPKLADGDYNIYVWVAGSGNGVLFPHQGTYEIDEGATVSYAYVNQDSQQGWVQLGARRYVHNATLGAPLVVRALAYSNDPTDQPAGRVGFTDAMRFVGAANLGINSTPLQVNGALIKMDTSGNPPVATDVTIVAAENGRIYCLDSNGNGTGTTNVYWTYPSTPDPSNASWTDPNQVAGLDGPGGIAEMPTDGFNLSSALVQRINGVDYLYIAAQNGRVYCIDMTGRGDMSLATRKPGTTTRVWSYPDDYPSTAKSSLLGPFTGSVVFANNAAGPTIFVPAPQGRIYALDAVGNGPAKRTTNVRWQYPAATAPALGQIVMTPAVDTTGAPAVNQIYFGTMAESDASTGEFYALNIDTGAVVWKFTGTAAVPADDFIAGPATVPGSLLGLISPDFDMVYVANENGYVYALYAQGDGAGNPKVYWSTNELGTGVQGSLSFSPILAYDISGNITSTPVPAVMVPTTDGRIDALLADATTNFIGGKQIYEYMAGSSFTSSLAVGRGWLVAATGDGNILAFNTLAGYISPGTPPGGPTITPNNPAGVDYRYAIVEFIGKADYTKLRNDVNPGGTGTVADYVADLKGATPVTGNPLAFEWGQTIYALVYNYPWGGTNTSGGTIPSAQANFLFSVPGGTVRSIAVESKQCANALPSPSGDGTALDGYAVLAYALQTGGQTSLAPGQAQMTASLTTGSLSANGIRQSVALDPATSRLPFAIANPLALVMNYDPAQAVDITRSIGYTVNPADPENLENGSRNTGVAGKTQSQLLSSVGLIAHGSNGTSQIGVVDRSLMTLLRGPGRGLDNVRYDRRDLRWNGGAGSVLKPLDPTLYPGYEDLPVNFPNTSLDYPDIGRQTVSVTKDPNGNAENPLFSTVSLTPPTFVDPTNPDPATRTLNVTPFDITVAVPMYQPPNGSFKNPTTINDSTGLAVPAGYVGRHIVFVDSNGNGIFVRGSGRREAYRSFYAAANVDFDERVAVTTPTVDLGSLQEGVMFSTGLIPPAPAYPWDSVNDTVFGPIPGWPFASFFQPFTVTNPGNVDLRNLRLAKYTKYEPNPVTPWPIFAPADHILTWLEPSMNVFTSLDDDPRWRLVDDNGNVHHNVALQKARVGDRAPTELNLNAVGRANANLGVDEHRLINNVNSPIYTYPPSITATIPIGMPVGTYLQTMRIINEDDPPYAADQALSMDQTGEGLETYSDPTFILRFNVRESRLTNSFTPGTAPMMDNLVAGNELFLHANMQPTILRTPDTGSLVVAWASTRAAFNEPEPGANAKIDPAWRIYLGSLFGTTPASAPGVNPLRELNFFSPAGNGAWFQQSASAPFPACTSVAQANDLFKADTAAGESVLLGTVSFGSPSFPVGGFTTNSGPIPGTYMAFVGEAQIQSPTGRTNVSRIFFAPLNVDAGGAATLGSWIRDDEDDTALHKSKPSVVEDGAGLATFFFSANASGQSQIMYNTYDPYAPSKNNPADAPHDKWSNITALSMGTGFDSVSSPSVYSRVYRGPNYAPSNLTTGQSLIEMTFAGKLRGRPNQEVFFGRMIAPPNGLADIFNGTVPAFSPLPFRVQEPLTADTGVVYRAQGVSWVLSGGFRLEQNLNGTVSNLEVLDAGGNPTTRTVDETTGLITFDSTLGGKVYVDPNIGTVRFSGATPSTQATLVLSYQPLFLRVSGPAQEAACSSPTGLFDARQIGDASYWARQGTGVGVRDTDTDQIPTDRYVFTYERSAAGTGQAARPFVRTVRLGVQLPTPVATDGNGIVVGLTVNGNVGPYQVDPAAGRVYFTDVDENQLVTVSYIGPDSPNAIGLQSTVTLVAEREETPIVIEQARNEGGLTSLLDPFDPGGQIGARRPGLIWLFWSSTRAGTPDLFFETIAPNWTPMPTSK